MVGVVVHILKEVAWLGVPITGLAIGAFFDNRETLRMTRYRDKSALYGRPRKEGEPPSWP